MILHGSVKCSKVFLSGKTPINKGHTNLATEVLTGFSPCIFNSNNGNLEPKSELADNILFYKVAPNSKVVNFDI